MTDIKKVLNGLECCTEWDSCNKCPYETPNEYDIAECTLSLHTDALAILKEQYKLLCKKQKDIDKLQADYAELRHKFLEKTQIVRCKDCKHRPREIPFVTSYGDHDTYLEFPKGSKCPCRNSSDDFYSWNPDDNWFCADGEMKT